MIFDPTGNIVRQFLMADESRGNFGGFPKIGFEKPDLDGGELLMDSRESVEMAVFSVTEPVG